MYNPFGGWSPNIKVPTFKSGMSVMLEQRRLTAIFLFNSSNITVTMEKVLTLGNSIVFANIALYENAVNWLNAESKFYTDLVNEGEDEKVSITRLDAIRYNAYIILGILFIGIVGSLENTI